LEHTVDEGLPVAGRYRAHLGAGVLHRHIELCFGATERSVEAYALAEGGDELDDFHDHTTCYDRATELGLLSDTTTRELQELYGTNRTDSYYGGRGPTQRQAETMQQLARSVHEYVTDQIREGGVCVCNSLD
jgi:hypothetical protein